MVRWLSRPTIVGSPRSGGPHVLMFGPSATGTTMLPSGLSGQPRTNESWHGRASFGMSPIYD